MALDLRDTKFKEAFRRLLDEILDSRAGPEDSLDLVTKAYHEDWEELQSAVLMAMARVRFNPERAVSHDSDARP
jgi:hypothetical protein